MADPVRIIIFQDSESTYIHSEVPLRIMHFSRGLYEIFEDDLIIIDDIDWSFGRIDASDAIKDFEGVWKLGEEFNQDPKRLQKIRKTKELDDDILNMKKKLEALEEERQKL